MTRTKKTMLAIAALGALAFAGGASAAGSTSLAITANVAATCTFDTGSYVMNFGSLDPSANVAANQVTPISYHCSTGQAASSIKINGNASPTTVTIANTVTPLNTMPVQLTWTTPATVGTGFGVGSTAISFNVNGTIAAADIASAVSGAYLSSYVVSLLP